ncbi:hypothetical protein CA234_04540 [Sphingomonas sp. ABOLE]|uniref:hypothetical protein n=1 Tax=Sphingomonas sp. ABOLE TaxID=1985878 RepID=UPI000F7D8E89|nr:hypothetical protein [Sphingomonas sp. ABOLE]RSV43477.1 hypothetical protein CA234_04540 [Sphingomonas sp. ABOLE]
MSDPLPMPSPRAAPTGAHATLRVGDSVALEARITTGGLVAVAAIVSAALLGSAVIVQAARRGGEVEQA